MPLTRTALLILIGTVVTTTWHAAGAAVDDDLEKTTQPSKKLDIRYVPTPQYIVDLMLELAKVKETDLVYDLGCGDGRIVVTAAKRYGCKAMGVDMDPDRVRESLVNVREAEVEDLVTIEQQDIFELDLSDADVVMVYLLPELNVRLIPQLEKMKPGSRIVSHDFDMPGVEPDIVVSCSSWKNGDDKIYLWTIPFTEMDTSLADQLPREFTLQQILLIVVAITCLLALALWALSRRFGKIKFHVSIDPPK